MPGASTIGLTARDGISFQVATGALCLDFVYTGGAGTRARWETLHEPADLERWVRSCRLAAVAPLPPLLVVTVAELAQARELREVLWRCGNDAADGRGVGSADAMALTRYAAAPDLVPALADGRAAWSGPVTGAQVVSAMARDAIALFGGPAADRVRRCAADDCALLFLDTSRPGVRRWCAMTRCGNRTKARTRRAARNTTPQETA